MGWRIIEINKNCHIKLFLGNLLISGDTKITIPISDIDVLMFTNNRTNITVNLINELAINNVCTIFCDYNYMPSSMILPYIGNQLTIKIFKDQLEWDQKFKDYTWSKIVEIKCNNQLQLLKEYNLIDKEQENIMIEYIKQIEPRDLTNREGHIAKLYWSKLFSKNFNRQQDTNAINAVLNFGYTILYSMISRSIVKKGLDARISLFHKSVWNHFLLASDLIEPFRMIVDQFVYKLYIEKIINNETGILANSIKESIIDFISNYKLRINGLYQFTNNAIDLLIDTLVKKEFNNFKIEYDFEIEIKKENNNEMEQRDEL